MRVTLLSLLISFGTAVEAAEFEFVVAYDGEQVRVECRSGCSVPMLPPQLADQQECPRNDCVVTVRDSSMSIARKPTGAVASLVTDSPDNPKFEIRLMPTDTGVSAQCSSGCSWREESFSCPDLPCVATIDELGIRLGDVAVNDPPRVYKIRAAQQDPRRQWIDCLVRYIVTARADGGPMTYGMVRREAQAACIEHRAGWERLMEEHGASPGEVEQTVDGMLRSVWETN